MATSAPPSFGWLVLQLAIKNTWAFFKRRLVEASVGIISLVIGGAIFLYLYGWSAVREQAIIFAAFVLAPGGLFVLLAFVWNLCLAPAQLVYDAVKGFGAPAAVAVAPKPAKQVNWTIWKQMVSYTIEDFAAILARNDPVSMNATNDQVAYQRLIMQDVTAKTLPYIPDFEETINGRRYERPIDEERTRIKKTDAIVWAERNHFDVSHIK